MRERRLFAVVLAMLLFAGCSWVELTPDGEKMRVLELAEVASCEKQGEVTVSLVSKVVGINRNEDKVQEELNMLARNAAVEMRGDSVVAMSAVVEGNQKFAVYKCIGVNR